MPELTDLTVAEASLLIAANELHPSRLVEACLARIAAIDPAVGAFITVCRDSALAEASALDQPVLSAHPLRGIPIALKDLIATRQVCTTAGSRILAGWLPSQDARVVRHLRDSGAVIIGKLNLHEFAYGVTNVNPWYGAVHNPWDLNRISGGSSGGSAAAVAASMCPAAIGSDTGGSIRIPASLCGVTGLKPTYGIVSLEGVVPLSPSQDHVGPLARTALDCALVLDAIAEPGRRPFAAGIADGVRGLRIGLATGPFLHGIHPEVEAAVRAAANDFRSLGAEVAHIDVPWAEHAAKVNRAVLMGEAAAFHSKWLRTRPEDYSPQVRQRLEYSAAQPPAEFQSALRDLESLRSSADALFQEIDLLFTATTPITAPSIEEEASITTLVQNTSPFDATGQPAISIPCGFDSLGLPIGLQIVSASHQDALVLRAAHSYQQATGWHLRRPHLRAPAR